MENRRGRRTPKNRAEERRGFGFGRRRILRRGTGPERSPRVRAVDRGGTGRRDASARGSTGQRSRGASGDGDGGAGFATTLGGFPLSGPIGAGGVEAGRGVKGFGANANANEKANENANGTEPSRFESWTVVDGKVSAPDAKEGTSPFPFDVDGLSMEELMSYEAQGFMSDVTRMPGFGATWERLKAAYLSEMSSEAADSGGFRTPPIPGTTRTCSRRSAGRTAARRTPRRNPTTISSSNNTSSTRRRMTPASSTSTTSSISRTAPSSSSSRWTSTTTRTRSTPPRWRSSPANDSIGSRKVSPRRW